MVKKSADSKTSNSRAKTSPSKSTPQVSLDAWLQRSFFGIWTVLGVVAIIFIAILMFGGNLPGNLSVNTTDNGASNAAQQQQPTQEQIEQQQAQQQKIVACVKNKVGDKRLGELQQGQKPNEKDTKAIKDCQQQ